MQFETPADTYKAYQKFLKKEEYKKAYQCLEKVIHEFPDEVELLDEMVELCLDKWNKPDLARKWLLELIKYRQEWLDYIFLSRTEALLGNINNANEYLEKARNLYDLHGSTMPKGNVSKLFIGVFQLIKQQEWEAIVKKRE